MVVKQIELNNMNLDDINFKCLNYKREHLFLPELIDLMGPLLNGTLFPYNSPSEKADADLIFSSIKDEGMKLLSCFSSAPEYHVNNFLANYQRNDPQIYLDNKQFVLTFRSRDDPCTWFYSGNDFSGGEKKHVPISDLIKDVNYDENHWLGDVLDSESKRIQSRVNKCKVRYGAILNFLVSNSSAVPILVKNVRQRKIHTFIRKNSYLEKSLQNMK